jgi:hypothetical protein
MFSAIFSVEYWNFMMKYTNNSSLFFPIVNSRLIFQNYFAIQLATIVMFFR